jgi:hypothetical protein
MKGKTHRLVTRKAFSLIEEMCDGIEIGNSEAMETVAQANSDTDNMLDLEFIDVESRKDNPHEDGGSGVNDDEARHKKGSRSFTAYNHFIDIKKADVHGVVPGIFDDYDGYAYRRGSAQYDQHQKGEEAASEFTEWAAAEVLDKMLDAGVMYWHNDQYVHVNGNKWYRGDECSSSTERYSYYREHGIYDSLQAELAARFPTAKNTGQKDHGVPYSVFMPLDNLGRYWYGQFIATGDVIHLGPLMRHLLDEDDDSFMETRPLRQKIVEKTIDLFVLAAAMSTLVLIKANQEGLCAKYGKVCTPDVMLAYQDKVQDSQDFQHFVGNRNSRELHLPDCRWVGLMSVKNRIEFLSLAQAIEAGFNGCFHCMNEYD